MKTCSCGRFIPIERIELGYRCCVVCGETLARMKRPMGYPHYGHKTAGAIVVTTKAGFQNYAKVSSRKGKNCNMGFASRVGTRF
jgi:hypothetical protein